jgi:XTP/dITP diphosphohydrolase
VKIVVATGNKDKVIEIKEILRDLAAEVVTMKEAGLFVEAEENGTTFLENAVLKAKAVATEAAQSEEWKDAVVMADDSGLVIDALNGEPGIYSARYLGHDTSYREKNGDLIRRLTGISDEQRSARFVCAMAAVCPDGEVLTTEGAMEGRIGYEEHGENGFGYDPIFYLPERGCTAAELSLAEKNGISHRGKALRRMREKLMQIK